MQLKTPKQNDDGRRQLRKSEKMIAEGRCPRKMVDPSTSAEAAEIGATTEHKKKGSKAKKTPEQKKAHNKICQKSRKNAKIKHLKLKAENQSFKKREEIWNSLMIWMENEIPKPNMPAENQMMDAELKQMNPMLIRMHNKIQESGSALQQLAANDEMRMKLALRALNVEGTKFSSIDEAAEWYAAQNYGQDGPKDTNIAVSAAGFSSASNHYLPSDALNYSPLPPDPSVGNEAGSPTASAVDSYLGAYPELALLFDSLSPDYFAAADYGLPDMFGAVTNHDSSHPFTDDPRVNNEAGFPTAPVYDHISGHYTGDPVADNKAGFQ